MKENNNFDFDKIFRLKGANILYPIIAVFFWFFYAAYFGQGVEFQKLGAETPDGPFWFVISCISFGLINIWCYLKGYITKQLIEINSFVYSLSFFMIAYELYHKLFLLLYTEAIICIYCAFMALRKPIIIKNACIWLCPVAFVVIYNIHPTITEVIISSVIFLSLLTFTETKGRKTFRYMLSICVIIIYLVTTFIYCPYNPFLSCKNIQSYTVSLNPKKTSLIINTNNKYKFIDGLSLTGTDLIDTEFDTIAQIQPYRHKFGGFEIENKYNIEDLKKIPSNISPIIIRDKFAYFSSDKNVYDFLDNIIHSNDVIDRITAQLYYDYINLCAKNDSVNQEKILKNGQKIQNIILKKLNIDNLKLENQGNAEKTLRQISITMTLGMLNALSLDLITIGDYTSALKIFSYQFYLTFYNTIIYEHIHNNFDVTINKNYGKEQTQRKFHIKDVDLNRIDTFDPWTQFFSMSEAFAELLVSNSFSQKIIAIIQSKDKSEFSNYSDIKDYIFQSKEDLDEIFKFLSEYKETPNISLYTSQIQDFLYSCVIANIYPDYNSYFLNRFNEISPMVPLNPLSQEAYAKFKDLYNSRFDKDIKEVNELKETIMRYDSIISFIGREYIK